ncbi:MAG: hypothetical protein RBT60_12120 [Candidatus Krumholzibacteria bacterium]|jgi:hypothetical protein|nr:hypothetical protein [Candidatus Krumholzibacteria bacterium]
MTRPVSLLRLLRFWLPLEATWLMMAAEGPFLAAVIARLADPVPNLAAYGVAYAFAIIVEAPVIMMMSAATAVVDARPGYLALRRLAIALNGGLTLVMLVVLATSAMGWLLDDLLRLTPEVARLTERSLWVLLPWPAAIGYRRFYQGILIRAGLTRRVTWGTITRLAAMAAGALLARGAGLPGVMVGAVALTCGVCVEAVASRLMAAGPVRRLAPVSAHPDATDLSWRGLSAFYWPLALTSIIALAIHPLVTFFMGRAAAPLESLAVLPVLNALVFIFRTPALSYQETAIAMLGEGSQNRRPVLAFAGLLAVLSTLGLLAVAWTPAASFWFVTVSGLSPDLAAYAVVPLRILSLMPALSVLLNLQRAILVHGRDTRPVTAASAVELGGLLGMLSAGVLGFGLVGVTAAAIAFMVGRLAANLALAGPARRILRRA